MTEREDNVYRAKLAEQAERYDGKAARMEIFGRVSEGGGVGGWLGSLASSSPMTSRRES